MVVCITLYTRDTPFLFTANLLTTDKMLTCLLYITSPQNLLFDVSGAKLWHSRNFKHLSCFFPGLLALGAHTLPLNLSLLDPRGLSPEAQRQYRLLERYDLRELHMAAAEGLATACWLMYADMPTGLGPEIVEMDPKSRLWIDEVEEWRARGGVGAGLRMPGLGAEKPILYTRPKKERLVEGPWDYVIKRPEYFLRPEVSPLRFCVLEWVVGVWNGIREASSSSGAWPCERREPTGDMWIGCPYLVGSGGVSIGARFLAEIVRFNEHVGESAGNPWGKNVCRVLRQGFPTPRGPAGREEQVVY